MNSEEIKKALEAESENICAQMEHRNTKDTPVRLRKVGGTRYICGKKRGHQGEHGDWVFVTQPEHARALRTGKL